MWDCKCGEKQIPSGSECPKCHEPIPGVVSGFHKIVSGLGREVFDRIDHPCHPSPEQEDVITSIVVEAVERRMC
jgi:hypothetical protein